MPEYPHAYCTAAVLCATAGCDHLDCRGGPFKAVFVGTDDEEGVTWASEYSSETGAWSALTTVDLSESTTVDFYAYVEMRPSLLTGDALYFVLELGKDFLMYDLGGQGLWVVDAPEVYAQGGIVMTAEDGALGFAGVEGNSIYMYSWQDGDEDGWADGDENVAGWEDGDEGISGWADGDESTAGWVLRRVINLRTLLPICNPSVSLNLVGFIEGTDTIFMDTDAGLFILELMSGKVRKVGEKGAYNTIVPYTSFYAPVHATG
uniref:F-box associated domain-containing protein n=1 Tax=Arundo donax TaxID=35708 RepID=A0A0A9DJH4_ARUDO